MAAPNNEQLLKELHAELADIERQQQDNTLSHSDQQMLDQAWEDVTNRIDALEQSLEAYQEYIERQRTEWYDAAEYLEEEEDSDSDEVDGYGERAAPAPAPTPSVTVQARFRVDSKTGTVTIEAVLPRPPSITIPPLTSLATGAPPAPRADQPVSICNCDSDGMCSWCQDQMAEQYEEQSDCRYCSGCHYCQTSDGYDPNGEI